MNKESIYQNNELIPEIICEEQYQQQSLPPELCQNDLSQIEMDQYQSWWEDLDPFKFGKVDIKTICKFISSCNLSETTLNKIIFFFKSQKEGLSQEQFFAMLRLIAHAQQGRTVENPDIIYLGAPLPVFHTEAIDVLINRPHRNSGSGHYRSKSVPYNFLSTINNVTMIPNNDYLLSRRPSLGSSSSGSSNSSPQYNNTTTTTSGYSLLLTQSFKPSAGISSEEGTKGSKNPFDDDYSFYPPPVPPQSTKPAHPTHWHDMSTKI